MSSVIFMPEEPIFFSFFMYNAIVNHDNFKPI